MAGSVWGNIRMHYAWPESDASHSRGLSMDGLSLLAVLSCRFARTVRDIPSMLAKKACGSQTLLFIF